MNNTYDSAETFANDVIKHAKTGWVNMTVQVGDRMVGIKAYGKWVQRIRVDMQPYNSGEFRTQKEMKAFIINAIGE